MFPGLTCLLRQGITDVKCCLLGSIETADLNFLDNKELENWFKPAEMWTLADLCCGLNKAVESLNINK